MGLPKTICHCQAGSLLISAPHRPAPLRLAMENAYTSIRKDTHTHTHFIYLYAYVHVCVHGKTNSVRAAVLPRETCSDLPRAPESRSSEVKALPKKGVTSLWIFKD